MDRANKDLAGRPDAPTPRARGPRSAARRAPAPPARSAGPEAAVEVDDGHAARPAPLGLDRDEGVGAAHQARVDQQRDGARVVDGRRELAVDAFVGRRRRRPSSPRRRAPARRAARDALEHVRVARAWCVRLRPIMVTRQPAREHVRGRLRVDEDVELGRRRDVAAAGRAAHQHDLADPPRRSGRAASSCAMLVSGPVGTSVTGSAPPPASRPCSSSAGRGSSGASPVRSVVAVEAGAAVDVRRGDELAAQRPGRAGGDRDAARPASAATRRALSVASSSEQFPRDRGDGEQVDRVVGRREEDAPPRRRVPGRSRAGSGRPSRPHDTGRRPPPRRSRRRASSSYRIPVRGDGRWPGTKYHPPPPSA